MVLGWSIKICHMTTDSLVTVSFQNKEWIAMCHTCIYISDVKWYLPTCSHFIISTNINRLLSTTWFFYVACSLCLIRSLLHVGEEMLNIFYNSILLSIISCYHTQWFEFCDYGHKGAIQLNQNYKGKISLQSSVQLVNPVIIYSHLLC